MIHMRNKYQECRNYIINFLLDSINRKRKKIEIIRKFNINKNTFNWWLIKLTKDYPGLYENDTGRILGIWLPANYIK